MTYELAKKLKEAGFPQNYTVGDYVMFQFGDEWKTVLVTHHGSEHQCDEDLNHRCECECNTCYPYMNRDALFVPKLSQLIGACGEEFYDLQSKGNGFWLSSGNHDGEWIEGFGSTPEEAVANLWLALNEK